MNSLSIKQATLSDTCITVCIYLVFNEWKVEIVSVHIIICLQKLPNIEEPNLTLTQ